MSFRTVKIKKKTQQHQMLMRMRSNRNSHSLLMGMKNIQPLWKTVWQFLTKLSMVLAYDLAITLLGHLLN